jgi:hypothetical protein
MSEKDIDFDSILTLNPDSSFLKQSIPKLKSIIYSFVRINGGTVPNQTNLSDQNINIKSLFEKLNI